MKKLYKRNVDNTVQQWWCEILDDKYRTCYGKIDGKITKSKWTTATPKNLNKKNSTTSEQQAIFEVESLYEKRKKQGYFVNIEDIDNAIHFKPMLAISFDEATFDEDEVYYCQPKFDGIRAIITKNGIYSRTGNKIVSVPHIEKSLKPLFIENPDFLFDGELYNHELKDDFNEIVSMVRKEKNIDFEKTRSLIQYHIYDILMPDINDAPFSSRCVTYNTLFENNSYDYIIPALTLEVKPNDFDSIYDSFIAKGYEGMIIRKDEQYQNKRSKYLIKKKDFETEEFMVVDILPGRGNRADIAGRVILDTSDKASIKGNWEYAKYLLKNKEKYIGGQVTVQFQGRTPDNSLRFPVAIAFYDKKRDI